MAIAEKKFIYFDYFYNNPKLFCWPSLSQRIAPAYKEPREYKPIESLKVAFELDRSMSNLEIIEKLGGKDKIGKKSVCMSQIEQLIENHQDDRDRILLKKDRHRNIFYVIGEAGELFSVSVEWSSINKKWFVETIEAYKNYSWSINDRVFSNVS